MKLHRGVAHVDLPFGSTLPVLRLVKPRLLWPYFALLIAALFANSVLPMSSFLALPGPAKVIASCSLVYLPVFFAGVIFATAFRDSTQPDIDFGSNIGGIILGGLSEYLSLMLGFNHLLWVAIAFYLLAALLRPGREATLVGAIPVRAA